MVENNKTIEYLKMILHELGIQLLDASTYWDIYVQLWPTNQTVEVVNRYKGFFQPARRAIFDQFSIKISNVMSNDPNVSSFNQVFYVLALNPYLAPGFNVHLLKERIKPHRKVLEAIENYRNTKAAHWDVKKRKVKEKPILFGECSKAIKELQDTYNEINGKIINGEWSFEYFQHNDTTSLLKHLDELNTIHQEKINHMMERVRK
jgi:hypothetical protein